MNRREALKSLAGGSALGFTGAVIVVSTSCAPTEAPAIEVDPTFQAISDHEQAWLVWQELDDTDAPECDAINGAELKAWETVCGIVPSTLAGLAHKAAYISNHAGREPVPEGRSLQMALTTIAWAALEIDGRAS